MYVKMQTDKSLVVTVPTTIYRGEANADTLIFLLPVQYDYISVADCTVMLRYIDPKDVGHSEQLSLQPEMYNQYLQYAIRIDTKLTDIAGSVRLWLSCVSSNDNAVFKTGELTITIRESVAIEEHLPPEDLDQIDKLVLAVENLERTKADNLVYDAEDGSLQLSAEGVLIGDEVILDGTGDFEIIDGGGAAD